MDKEGDTTLGGNNNQYMSQCGSHESYHSPWQHKKEIVYSC